MTSLLLTVYGTKQVLNGYLLNNIHCFYCLDFTGLFVSFIRKGSFVSYIHSKCCLFSPESSDSVKVPGTGGGISFKSQFT